MMSLWAIANVGLPALGAMVTAGAAAVVGAPVAVAAGVALVGATAVALRRRLAEVP